MLLFPNDVRRDIGSLCANRERYVGWPNDYLYSYIRMVPVVTSARGAQFMKDTLVGLMTVLPVFITAHELVLKTNVFRFLVSTRGARLAGSMFKPLSNQSLHGSGPRTFSLFPVTVSPAP